MYDTGSGFEDAQIDNMTLGYYSETNKLKTVTDAAPCPDKKVLHQAMDNTELHAVEQTIEADNLVNETADIIYQAGTSVTLKAGFHAKAGTNFVAKIDVCPSGSYETGGLCSVPQMATFMTKMGIKRETHIRRLQHFITT